MSNIIAVCELFTIIINIILGYKLVFLIKLLTVNL